jgi:hypothetical protein
MTAARIVENAIRLRARAGWRKASEYQQKGRESGKAGLPGVDGSIHARRLEVTNSPIKHVLFAGWEASWSRKMPDFAHFPP